MHAGLIANTAWLDEELASFRQLVVGLIDEQVRVTQVVPDSLPDEDTSAFSSQVRWQDSSWTLLRRWRLTRLVDRLANEQVSLIHALDGRTWDAAVRLAGQLGTAAVLSATSKLDVPLVKKMLRRAGQSRVAFAPATKPLAEAITQRISGDTLVHIVPPGVHPVEHTPRPTNDGHALCAVVTGNGIFDEHYAALFEAMQSLVSGPREVQFFLDCQDGDPHRLWQSAQRYGLLSNMSMAPRRLGHREVLMGADALIQPQPLGRARSLILHAMAHGLVVLAHADPWVDYLRADQTAWLVQQPDPGQWVHLLLRLVDAPSSADKLGADARQWVREKHRATQQIDKTLALYRRVTGESFKFPARQAG